MIRNLNFKLSDKVQDWDAIKKQFFAESNFRFLSIMILDIEHLHQQLSMMLFSQIKIKLSQLIENIKSDILSCCWKLKKLESAHIILNDQKNFLVDLNDDFQKFCKIAIKDDYKHDFFADWSLFDKRLSTMIINMRMNFKEEIQTEEAQWKIMKNASCKKRCWTQVQTIKEVHKLLRMSRECEVWTSFHFWIWYVH